MTHIITSLCLRDNGCMDVCPVECINPGETIDLRESVKANYEFYK